MANIYEEKIVLLDGTIEDAEFIHMVNSGFCAVVRTADGKIHHGKYAGYEGPSYEEGTVVRDELPGYDHANAHSAFAKGEPWRNHHQQDCQQCAFVASLK